MNPSGSPVDSALQQAFIEIAETAQRTGDYPGTWSVTSTGDTRTVEVDRLATANWIESVAHIQQAFPGKVQYILKHVKYRA